MKRLLLLSLLACFFTTASVFSQEFKFDANLDPFLKLPDAYRLTPADLNKMFDKGRMRNNPYYEWLTRDKNRAIFKRKPASNVLVNLSIMGGEVPVQEMIVDFENGKFLGVTISIFNRGDAGAMESDVFSNSVELVGRHMGQQLATRGNELKAQGGDKGILTEGYIWISARGMAILEYNPGARSGGVSFLRMRMCRRDARGAYAAAMQGEAKATVRQSELTKNTKKDLRGNVFVDNVPMVDQGGKGYCVVASVQRLFEYYGAPCDMHQLAEIAKADPDRGTSVITTNRELGSIDHLFKMRYSCLAVAHRGSLMVPDDQKGTLYVTDKKVDQKGFVDIVKKYTHAGIPLLWALQLGGHEEIPAISPQTQGGHMRLIIGYNDHRQALLFSDSWGAGHELKSMKISDAYRATDGVFLMKPVTN